MTGPADEDCAIAADLRAAGVDCRSVWDLVNSKQSWPAAIPVLLAHLANVRNLAVKEGVVRALADPAARGRAEAMLIAAFRTSPDMLLKWTIANSLASLELARVKEDVLEIAAERRHGIARQRLVACLFALGEDRRVRRLLVKLLDDPDVDGHAAMALAQFGDPDLASLIGRFCTDRRAWVRNQVRRALARSK